MEINLLYFVNSITRWKTYNFYLFNDELIYGKSEEKSDMETKHISLLSFPQSLFQNQSNTAQLSYLHNELIGLSSDDPNNLEVFNAILSYLKTLYHSNCFSFGYLNKHLNKITIKELSSKINDHLSKSYINLMITNLKNQIQLDKSFIEVQQKLEEYDKNVFEIITKKKIDNHPLIIKELINCYRTFSEEINNDKGKGNNEIKEIDMTSKANLIMKYYEIIYKIAIEINHTINEITINQKHKLLMKRDIIFSFIFLKAKQIDYSVFQLENNKLNAKKCESMKQQIILKQKVIDYFKETDNQLYCCFKCGSILFLTSGTDSTCHYDSKCTFYSLFSCLKCTIAYCTYCVPYYKNSKCARGHLIFQISSGIVTKKCVICFRLINQDEESAGCTICQLPICYNCFNYKSKSRSPKCLQCNQYMSWKRSLVNKCEKCKMYVECFWFCFFCYTKACCNCYPTQESYCGGSHELEKVKLENSIFDEKNYKSIHHFFLEFKKKSTVFCIKCGKVFMNKYWSCNRCLYNICTSCYVKEDWNINII